MDQQTTQTEAPVFGTMIGILSGQKIDTERLKAVTKASARHSLWEGPDSFDADEPGASHLSTQLPTQH